MGRAFAVVAGLVLLAGCGTSDVVVAGEPVPDPYDGPMRVSIDHADQESARGRSGAAGRALECATDLYGGGSGAYDTGLASTQDSAESALQHYFSEGELGQLPPQGYRVEREDDGRVLFSYDVRGRTVVAVIVADGIRDFNGDEGWGVETWAQCDPSELPAAVTDALGVHVWNDARGNRVPVATITSYRGPEHCDWQDITFLVLGSGKAERRYLRDTKGELGGFLATTFDASATLPREATDTGFERDGRHLWLHPDGTAAYLVDTTDSERVERWPAAEEGFACA